MIFDHMTLQTNDFDRSIDFYQEALLPLEVDCLFSPQRSDGPIIAGLGRGNAGFFLAEGEGRI